MTANQSLVLGGCRLCFGFLQIFKLLCSSVGECPAQETHLVVGSDDGGDLGIHQSSVVWTPRDPRERCNPRA